MESVAYTHPATRKLLIQLPYVIFMRFVLEVNCQGQIIHSSVEIDIKIKLNNELKVKL